MAKQDGTEDEVTEVETLNQLSSLAKAGYREMIAVGKLKEVRPGKADAAGNVRIYAGIIVGEGDTLSVEFDQAAARPPAGFEGAFLLSPREFKGQIAGFNVIGFR